MGQKRVFGFYKRNCIYDQIRVIKYNINSRVIVMYFSKDFMYLVSDFMYLVSYFIYLVTSHIYEVKNDL